MITREDKEYYRFSSITRNEYGQFSSSAPNHEEYGYNDDDEQDM